MLPATGRQHRGCTTPQAATHSLVLPKMGKTIARNMKRLPTCNINTPQTNKSLSFHPSQGKSKVFFFFGNLTKLRPAFLARYDAMRIRSDGRYRTVHCQATQITDFLCIYNVFHIFLHTSRQWSKTWNSWRQWRTEGRGLKGSNLSLQPNYEVLTKSNRIANWVENVLCSYSNILISL